MIHRHVARRNDIFRLFWDLPTHGGTNGGAVRGGLSEQKEGWKGKGIKWWRRKRAREETKENKKGAFVSMWLPLYTRSASRREDERKREYWSHPLATPSWPNSRPLPLSFLPPRRLLCCIPICLIFSLPVLHLSFSFSFYFPFSISLSLPLTLSLQAS